MGVIVISLIVRVLLTFDLAATRPPAVPIVSGVGAASEDRSVRGPAAGALVARADQSWERPPRPAMPIEIVPT
jgi:hypothetical protein